MRHQPDMTMMRYLLGDISEQERDRIEEQYFENDQLFEECLMAEDELVDAYINGELNTKQRDQFLQNFLITPERIEKVKFARALKELVSESESGDRKHGAFTSRWKTVFAAAAVLIVAMTAFLWARYFQSQDQLAAARNEQNALRKKHESLEETLQQQSAKMEQLIADLQREKEFLARRPDESSTSAEKTIHTIDMVSALVRGSKVEWQTAAISNDVEVIRLRLQFDGSGYPYYRAILMSSDEQELWSQSRIRPDKIGEKLAVSILLPAKALVAGNYILVLQGQNQSLPATEDVAVYYFKLQKK